MRLDKKFRVKCSRDDAVARVASDETLVGLFPDSETEIVASEGDRRTTRTRYRALGREGVATFNFTFLLDGNVRFEKVCDGNVWRELVGTVTLDEKGSGTEVKIAMQGSTKSLVPEFTIKGPMRDQIEDMAAALRDRLERG